METLRGYRRKPDFRRPGRSAPPRWLVSLAVTAVAMAAISMCGVVLVDGSRPKPAPPGHSAARIPEPDIQPGITAFCFWDAVMPGAVFPPARATATRTERRLRIATNYGDLEAVLLPLPVCALTSIVHLAGLGAYQGVACVRPTGPQDFAFRCPPAQDPTYRLSGTTEEPVDVTDSRPDMVLLAGEPGGELLFVVGDPSPPEDYAVLGVVEPPQAILRLVDQPGAEPLVIHSVELRT